MADTLQIVLMVAGFALLAWRARPSGPLQGASDADFVRRREYVADQEAVNRRITELNLSVERQLAAVNGALSQVRSGGRRSAKEAEREEALELLQQAAAARTRDGNPDEIAAPTNHRRIIRRA